MRMRVLSGVAAAGAALALPVGAIAQGPVQDPIRPPATQVHVGPRTIGTHTTVLVRFRQPMTTGRSGGERRIETLWISGPRRARCIGSRAVVLNAARAGTMIRHRLRPRRLGNRWCTGLYEGRVTYQVVPYCTGPGPIRTAVSACPMFVTAPRTLATFHFRVTAR